MAHSNYFHNATIYCRNIRPIKDLFMSQSHCIAKRLMKNQPVCVNRLASSSMLKSLARKLNQYCKQMGEPNCIETGDMIPLAELVINQANEIIWQMR